MVAGLRGGGVLGGHLVGLVPRDPLKDVGLRARAYLVRAAVVLYLLGFGVNCGVLTVENIATFVNISKVYVCKVYLRGPQ